MQWTPTTMPGPSVSTEYPGFSVQCLDGGDGSARYEFTGVAPDPTAIRIIADVRLQDLPVVACEGFSSCAFGGAERVTLEAT